MRAAGVALALCLLAGGEEAACAQAVPDYKNAALPTERRVQDLLARMTPEEKFWQLFMIPGDLDASDPERYRNGIFGLQVSASAGGDGAAEQMLHYAAAETGPQLAKKINTIQRYFVEHTRLGIPIVAFDEALHGLVRDGATAFPQSLALAATFDTDLMQSVAAAIADETKGRGIRQVLSPVINIASDVRWGRTEETYGEDPFLAAEMAVAYVHEFERRGVITTLKHLIANVGDGGRDSYPIHASARWLEEEYFPPFEAALRRGGARSVMTSYNSLDDVASSANAWLLNTKLKTDWRFAGTVVSDAGAVGGTLVLHDTATDYPDSAQQAVNAGLDVTFQTRYEHYKLFMPPFLDGRIPQARIDDAAKRVLRAKFELGLFEHPYVDESVIRRIVATDKSHKAIARRAALESIVLLKNSGGTLPLRRDLRALAVIGTDAVEARLGGYSGPGNGKVSILDGIKARAGSTAVGYAPGCGRKSTPWQVVPAQFLTHDGELGLRAEYFNNVTLEGKPDVQRTDPAIDFHWTLSPPDPKIGDGFYSVRWSGTLRSPQDAQASIGLEGNDGFRLSIDGQRVIDNWSKQSYHTAAVPFHFEKGRDYAVQVEFFEPVGNAHLKLIWNVGVQDDCPAKIAQAVNLVRRSDAAVVVAGIQEGEFQDRAILSLPGEQERLIEAIAATGKPVVVLLIGGSAITMSHWIDRVGAVVDAWYPGEEGGPAVAAVLFGDESPAGRLPITFPQHEGQLPLLYNHQPTGRGDDYNDLSGEPLFPFGFGLSYAQFAYSGIRLDKMRIAAQESTALRVTVRNTATRAADEVVQLYIKQRVAPVATPVMQLKGFRRVHLAPGEKKDIVFPITPQMLSLLDKDLQRVVAPGVFRLMVGASSKDIRQRVDLEVAL